MDNIKYIAYGGQVRAKDGDIHYVSASQVAQLYGVNPKDCILVNYSTPDNWDKGYNQEWLESLIELHVRRDGKYEVIK